MDVDTAVMLAEVNSRFYSRNAGSFSSTRKFAWPGWDRIADIFSDVHRKRLSRGQGDPVRVLDIACGNMRFERYLTEYAPHVCWEFFAVDNCRQLVGQGMDGVCFSENDIVSEVLAALEAPVASNRLFPQGFDLSVCFGFYHHVPGACARTALLSEILESLAPGGVACISLWRFAEDERMREKAEHTTSYAREKLGVEDLEEGDWLLGWQGMEGEFRYCHSFSEDDVSTLVAHARGLGFSLKDRFEADGRTGAMNTYLVFSR